MPKRRSLVGTAREAIGKPPLEAPKPSPPKPRAAPKAKRAAEPAAPPPERPSAPEPSRAAIAAPATPYDAMMSFANATLRQNMEAGARLAQCKTPMEALAIQTGHLATLTQSFYAASLKLMHADWAGAPWLRLRSRIDPQ
ncbi:MAG TPA: hypothetical protein VKU84_00575 [Stellaceae bacterium]|nr:hypothetical protein [Stellaceae bacterium]